jgi:hypothetical protein
MSEMNDGELFEQVGDDDWRCTVCDRRTSDYPDLIDSYDFPSYGGSTEGYDRCNGCETTRSWADLSAVR